MEISQFAPVMIPTLNRYVHFKRCVGSLSRCTHAEKTDLYIALDYPAKEEHWEGYNKIKEYLKTIKGFNKIEIIEREKNLGALENIRQARKYIFSKYDRIILSEDDNEFSPNFLDYINKGLDKFEDDPNVLAVCGYRHPFNFPKNYSKKYYFSKGFTAWGYGITKQKDNYIREYFTSKGLRLLLRPISVITLIKNKRLRNVGSLLNCYKLNKFHGDTIISSITSVTNKFSVYPSISLVRNIGQDGSGIHSADLGPNNLFHKQSISENNFFDFSENIKIKKNDSIEKQINKYLKINIRKKIKLLLSYVQYLFKEME